MHIQNELKQRLSAALSGISSQPEKAANQLRPTQDPRNGDYQANCVMSLKAELGKTPEEIASSITQALQVDDMCESVEVAGKACFINFTLSDSWIGAQATGLLRDDRVGVDASANPKTVVIDYSSPNVAKPMHVGHIRSTVIGDTIANLLSFAGHKVIRDNHLGDWGTQFGMIIYGYRNFLDKDAYENAPIPELLRLYRIVNSLIDYHKTVASIPSLEAAVPEAAKVAQIARETADSETEKKAKKKAEKNAKNAEKKFESAKRSLEEANSKLEKLRSDDAFVELAESHQTIPGDVLRETAKLHEGDESNLQLWHDVLPHCRDEIDRIYTRLKIEFDHQYGESFYHEMLPGVIDSLGKAGLLTESEGAQCVFLPEFDAPMIVQKKDGAFLYSTTDLATLQYRMQEWSPDEILYVTDSRQAEHFEKVFIVGKKMGFTEVRLKHIPFGMVLDKQTGRPYKTKSGSNVGLELLLDDAVAAANAVVCDPGRIGKIDPPLSDDEKKSISLAVGHGAIKYADLGHNRESDYRFDLEKMVDLNGNTAAYILYSYARTQNILVKGETSEQQVAAGDGLIVITAPQERRLAMLLLQFGEAIDQALDDYRPNVIVDYLYELAKATASFYEACPVLSAPSEELKASRLMLVAATGKVLRKGLDLLGIDVVPRM